MTGGATAGLVAVLEADPRRARRWADDGAPWLGKPDRPPKPAISHTAGVDIGTWIFIVVAALAVLGGVTGYVLQYRDGDRRPPLDGIERSGAISE